MDNKPKTKTPEGGGNVTITKDQLDQLMGLADEIKQLKKQSNKAQEGGIIVKKVKEHYATLRKYNDRYLIGFEGRNFIEKDKNGDKVEYCKINLMDIESGDIKTEKVEYYPFLNDTPKEKILIKKIHVDEVVEEDGRVEVTKVVGDRTEGTGFFVPVETTSIKREFDVELQDGKPLTVSEKVINA